MRRTAVMALVLALAAVALVAAPPERSAAAVLAIGPDVDVVFESTGIPIHGSLRAPASGSQRVPGAVIIGGSGSIDRNGAVTGSTTDLDTYRWIADRLSEQGVASLRYDKVGVGATGLGPYTADPAGLGDLSFDQLRVQPARDALALLAQQPEVDPGRLFVVGHSEGGMVTLALDARPGNGPKPAGLALIEPQYAPILDIISVQLGEAVSQLVGKGEVAAGDGAILVEWLEAGLAEIRSGTPPFPPSAPDPLPAATGATAQLQAAIRMSVYDSDPSQAVLTVAMRTRFGKEADQLDPVELARSVSVPVLITCGERDTNTPCVPGGAPGTGVAALAAALPSTTTSFAVAPGTEHFLRDIGTDVPTDAQLAGYPYSTVIEEALEQFAASFVPSPSPSPSTDPTVTPPRFTG